MIQERLSRLDPGKVGAMIPMCQKAAEVICAVLDQDHPYRALFFAVLRDFDNRGGIALQPDEEEYLRRMEKKGEGKV